MPRDCVSFAGAAPSSNRDTTFALCAWAWCCHQKVVPDPIRKLDRFPPSRHIT